MPRIILGTAALAATLLTGCLGEPIDPAAEPEYPTGHDGHHDDPSAVEALGAADIVLDAHAGYEGDEFAFHPARVSVPVGAVVEVRVANGGAAPHTFTVHAFDADTGRLDPGTSATIKFRAAEAGEFEIMCDEPGHYEAGMKATLVVA